MSSILAANIRFRRLYLYGWRDAVPLVAAKVGMQTHIYKTIESGEVKPSPILLGTIATVLQTESEDLNREGYNPITGKCQAISFMHSNHIKAFISWEVALLCLREREMLSGFHPFSRGSDTGVLP